MVMSDFAWTIVGQLQLKCSVIWSGPALIVAAAMHNMYMTKGIQSSKPRDTCPEKGGLQNYSHLRPGLARQPAGLLPAPGWSSGRSSWRRCLGRVSTCSRGVKHLEAAPEANDAALE